MRARRDRLSRHNPVAQAIDYMLKRWQAFARFLDDVRICLTNNAAERGMRGVATGFMDRSRQLLSISRQP